MRQNLWVIGLSALVFSLTAWEVARPALLGAQSAVVAVRLTEFQIEMPTTLPAGLTTFSVTNAGQMEHNFEIEPALEEEDPVEEPLPPNLQPGETRTIQVELTPGIYEVECPLSDHAELGMELQVTVTP
jgi:uncharacterized cupredoxin-like copper-binding protein